MIMDGSSNDGNRLVSSGSFEGSGVEGCGVGSCWDVLRRELRHWSSVKAAYRVLSYCQRLALSFFVAFLHGPCTIS